MTAETKVGVPIISKVQYAATLRDLDRIGKIWTQRVPFEDRLVKLYLDLLEEKCSKEALHKTVDDIRARDGRLTFAIVWNLIVEPFVHDAEIMRVVVTVWLTIIDEQFDNINKN